MHLEEVRLNVLLLEKKVPRCSFARRWLAFFGGGCFETGCHFGRALLLQWTIFICFWRIIFWNLSQINLKKNALKLQLKFKQQILRLNNIFFLNLISGLIFQKTQRSNHSLNWTTPSKNSRTHPTHIHFFSSTVGDNAIRFLFYLCLQWISVLLLLLLRRQIYPWTARNVGLGGKKLHLERDLPLGSVFQRYDSGWCDIGADSSIRVKSLRSRQK